MAGVVNSYRTLQDSGRSACFWNDPPQARVTGRTEVVQALSHKRSCTSTLTVLGRGELDCLGQWSDDWIRSQLRPPLCHNCFFSPVRHIVLNLKKIIIAIIIIIEAQEEMVQLLRGLSFQLNFRNWIPDSRAHEKNWDMAEYACNVSIGGVEKGTPWRSLARQNSWLDLQVSWEILTPKYIGEWQRIPYKTCI